LKRVGADYDTINWFANWIDVSVRVNLFDLVIVADIPSDRPMKLNNGQGIADGKINRRIPQAASACVCEIIVNPNLIFDRHMLERKVVVRRVNRVAFPRE
jgi:hypothetical protein